MMEFFSNRRLLSVLMVILLSGCGENNPQPSSNSGSEIVQSAVSGQDSSYVGPNYAHHLANADLNLTTENQWDSLSGHTDFASNSSPRELNPVYKTLGWHIYSKGSAYKSYDFSMLWGISYFSYILDPASGSYKDLHSWKTTALVDSAHKAGTKVFLTVSNFGPSANAQFLADSSAQATLADSLIALLKLRDADGITFDFEGVAKANRKQLTSCIQYLNQRLKAANPDYQTSLALYAVDWNHVFEIPELVDHVDIFAIMAYDYYGSFSKHAGPVSPLHSSDTWGSSSVASSVKYYLDGGVPPAKLIVGLPYYGAEWKTKSEDIPGTVDKFLAHPPYSQAKDLGSGPTMLNKASATSYRVFKVDGSYRQLWFDDSTSLAIKYDYVKSQNLAGIGIWALGYDHGSSTLWNLMRDKFGKD